MVIDISARSLKIGLLTLIVVLAALVAAGTFFGGDTQGASTRGSRVQAKDMSRVKARTAENGLRANSPAFRTIHQGAIE
jgi:flagellar basal body-associated protein FliL